MNFNTLDDIINQYKLFINSDEYDKLYKWKAIKTFQNIWDLEAKDFT